MNHGLYLIYLSFADGRPTERIETQLFAATCGPFFYTRSKNSLKYLLVFGMCNSSFSSCRKRIVWFAKHVAVGTIKVLVTRRRNYNRNSRLEKFLTCTWKAFIWGVRVWNNAFSLPSACFGRKNLHPKISCLSTNSSFSHSFRGLACSGQIMSVFECAFPFPFFSPFSFPFCSAVPVFAFFTTFSFSALIASLSHESINKLD